MTESLQRRAPADLVPASRPMLTQKEYAALLAGQLFIGFFNMSGELPIPEDFEGITDLSDDERKMIGLKPRGARARRLLGDGRPVKKPLAVAPIRVRTRGQTEPVFYSRLKFSETAWVTHFVIVSRRKKVLAAAQLPKPIATKPGNGLSLGFRLSDLNVEIVARRPRQRRQIAAKSGPVAERNDAPAS